MVRDVQVESPLPELQELFDHFHLSNRGIAEACRALAKHLNRQMRPSRHWGWQYIHQVLRHQILPSKRLTLAIFRLHQKVFGEPEPVMRTVSILAPIGFIPPKAVVLVRARTCALKTCQRSFIPINPNQIYHSPTCRKHNQLRKRSDEKAHY